MRAPGRTPPAIAIWWQPAQWSAKSFAARGEARALPARRRDRRPVPDRRDVADERADLRLAEQHPRPPRLGVRVVERHVAGADVEVGAERARVLQRRALVLQPLAARPVAAAAVRRIQALALRDARDHAPRRCRGVRGGRERRAAGSDASRFMPARNCRGCFRPRRARRSRRRGRSRAGRPGRRSEGVRAGRARPCRRACVSRNVTSAASHAATTTSATAVESTPCTTGRSSPHCAPATWHDASLMK